MCAVLFFPLGFHEPAQKVGRAMCAVLFFPLGLKEAAHKEKGGYLQKVRREFLSWIGLQTSSRGNSEISSLTTNVVK